MEIVKLKFTSSLHLSRGKSTLDESFDVLHSDTLKSALFVCALELYGQTDILNKGDGKDFFEKFTISSAFPFVADNLFFPKPELLPNGLTDGVADNDRKRVKKLRYFDKMYFQKLLNAEPFTFDINHISNEKYYTQSALLENQPFISDTVQRTNVSRTFEEEGDTFYTERLYFTEGCGLFFIIEIHDETIRPKIEAALRLLGDNGIGSDKSVGNGQFESKWETISFELPDKSNKQIKQVALSLYCPSKKSDKQECLCDEDDNIQDEAFLNGSAYNLIKRGGYIANPDNFDKSTLRKKSIVMFTEGSVFPNDRKLTGKIVDLKPENRPDVEHPIWRDGKALFLPYNLKEDA